MGDVPGCPLTLSLDVVKVSAHTNLIMPSHCFAEAELKVLLFNVTKFEKCPKQQADLNQSCISGGKKLLFSKVLFMLKYIFELLLFLFDHLIDILVLTTFI